MISGSGFLIGLGSLISGTRFKTLVPLSLLFTFLASTSAFGSAANNSAAMASNAIASKDWPAILILGDSISAAYNMEQAEAWPALLSARLEQDGYAYRVFNSSITGDTTEGGLSRLSRLLQNQQPAVVIVELGGNDGLRGLSLEVTRNNLQQMILQSQQAGAAVVLAGIQLPPNYGQSYTEQFAGMYAELAEQHQVNLIPFILEGIALNPELMQEDGIHPNAQAQPLLLEHVWTDLQPLLKKHE